MDLLTIVYKLYVRSVCEYWCAVFHTFSTQELNDKLEAIQSTALKVILAETYTDYKSALDYFSIDPLYERRIKHMLQFALTCTTDTHNKKIFPKNKNQLVK